MGDPRNDTGRYTKTSVREKPRRADRPEPADRSKDRARPATLSESVAEKIRDIIRDESLKPGDRLPTEQELVDRFGVSRVSVREATKALGYLGVIRAMPRRGLTVGEIDMHRVSRLLQFQFALSDYPDEQLVRARIVIEVGALPFVAERIAENPALCDELWSYTTRPGITDDLDKYIEADIGFHQAMVAASGIEPLVAFNELLHVFFEKFRPEVAASARDMKAGIKIHRQIIDALRQQQVTQAQDILYQAISQNYLHDRGADGRRRAARH